MKALILLIVVLIYSRAQQCTNQATSINFIGDSKHGDTTMNKLACNPQTNIDFTFGQSASGILNMSAPTSNFLSFVGGSNGDSKLQFLDLNGNNRSYSLKGITLARAADGRVPITNFMDNITHQISFTFQGQAETNEDTILVVYLRVNSTPVDYNEDKTRNVIRKNASTPNGIQSFRALAIKVSQIIASGAIGTIEQLSGALSPFRSMDYGKFYTVQSSTLSVTSPVSTCKTNFLISAFVYQIDPSTFIDPTTSPAFILASNSQKATGDFLCFGSHVTGLFQTHMRQSYPLWAAWFGCLIFWCAILFAESTTVISLYDTKFQDNKWTSWEMYSLFHLAHEEYFTRMLRTTSVYVCFTISCLVNACLYGELGVANPNPITILWMGAIGGVAGFIFSFPLGIFIQGFYTWTQNKYIIKKQIKDLQDKESIQAQTFDREIDECDDKIYTYYYWYYVFCITVLFICWGISVNEMQKLPRENYFQMWYWVGSIGVSFVLSVFVLSVIFTAIMGNSSFYKSRGFWYPFTMGQSFKEIQE